MTGLYKNNDENEKLVVFDEDALNEQGEFPIPPYQTLKAKETWVHLHPNIMDSGRCGHYLPKELNEE